MSAYTLRFAIFLFESNFHSFEVVGRGSDTQLQVSENMIYLI